MTPFWIYVSLVLMVVVLVVVCIKTLVMACDLMDGGNRLRKEQHPAPQIDDSNHLHRDKRNSTTNNKSLGRMRARSLSNEGKKYISVAV